MAKVTRKLQVTVPKLIADRFGIRPGDDLKFLPGETSLQIVLPSDRIRSGVEERLRLFDQATERQRDREGRSPTSPAFDRGWRREDLYARGLSD